MIQELKEIWAEKQPNEILLKKMIPRMWINKKRCYCAAKNVIINSNFKKACVTKKTTWGQNRKFWGTEGCCKVLALRTWKVWYEGQELAWEKRDGMRYSVLFY